MVKKLERFEIDRPENEIGTMVIGAAIEIHKGLGPGLPKEVYKTILSHELDRQQLNCECDVAVPIKYKNFAFDEGFSADLIVLDKVILLVETKDKLELSDKRRLQSYLRLTGIKLGYILNFGAPYMKDGILRAVNCLEEIVPA